MGQHSPVGILALGLFAVLTVVGIAGRALPPPTDGSLRQLAPRLEAGLNRFATTPRRSVPPHGRTVEAAAAPGECRPAAERPMTRLR
jgi:hypothetical protein